MSGLKPPTYLKTKQDGASVPITASVEAKAADLPRDHTSLG
jgi:hypothetical protein